MFSFAAVIRALCRRRPTLLTRKSARADRRLKRAAGATVEAMEQRVLLSAAPPGVQFSADAIYADSGNPGAYFFDLSEGTATFDTDMSKAGSDWQNVTLQLGDGTKAIFNSPQTLGGLQLAGSAKLTASTGGGGANGNFIDIGLGGLSMAATSTIDLADNDMILQGAGSAGVAQLQSLVSHAFNGGNWLGLGVGSSNAAMSVGSAMQTAEGFALNGSLTTPFGIFDGVPVTSADVIDRYTVMADANLDGTVNLIDYRILRNNLNKTGMTWGTGDFNYNGTTDTADYNLLQANYLGTIYGPNEARVLQPIGQTIAALANGTYTGPLGEVTDSNNPTADPSTVSYYAASVDWGNNNFVPCTVTADGNGGFTVSGTSPFPLTDPNALITMDVGYASGSPYAGQLSALSTPITLVSQAITNLTATAASTSEIDLAFNLAVSNATGIQVGRSTDGTNFTTIATLAATATTYADTGLSIASHYWYQVSALPLSGDGAMSSIDTYSLPAAATGLSVSMSGGAADLSWTNNDPSAPPYDIEQSPDGVNFTVIDETAAGATTYVDANPTEGIGYYRVDAVNADGTASNPSGIAAVTNAVVPPSDLSAQAVSASEIDLSWTNNSALADGITILCSTDGNTFFTLVALTDPTIETYADTGLAAGTHDFYEVEATKGLIASVPCTEADDTTTPPTPSGLSVTPGATPSSGLNLSWTAAQGAAGYDVQREAAGSAWQTISQLSGGTTTTFADTNLWDGIAYSYQIDAFNNSGTSPMSDIVTSATALTAPNEPTVQACALSLTSAQVVWVNHAYNESSFLIERSQDNGATWTTLGTVAPGADTYIDTGLTPNSSYEYKVTAQNAAGGGAGSAAVVTGIPYIPSNSVQGLQYASELGPDGMPSHGFFEVTRAGDVSQSASLGYTIDTTPPGSATPGYEYQTLSGSVAFSAGQSTALVQLTPREITHVEANTNVTLDIAGGNSTTGVASAGIVNTDGATISMTEAPMDAGEDAPQTLSYLNFYRRPAVATITITSNPSSAMSVDNSPVTTGSDGTGVVQLLGLSAGSVTLHCADPAGNAVDVPEQVDIPQLTITQEKLTFQDPQTKNQIPQTIGKDAGGTYSGMQWNDVFNGAKWTQTRIDEARKTQGYPVAYQVGGTIKMIVNFYVTLGSFKHAPAGTWLVYGTANGPNDPAPFFEGNGTATVSGGAIRVMATLTANEALPETISNSDLDIRWFLGFTPSVGTWTSNADGPDSINHLYVTRGLSKTTLIYETEYDIGCRAATGLIDETQTLNAIWAQFSGDSVVAADDKTVLYYASIGGSSDSDLLKAHKGQCDTWAALLAKTFLAQGIIARRIKVLPPGGYSWIRLYPTSAQGLGANGNFPNPTFRYHYLVEAQDFQTEAFDPSFGGSPATGATLAAIETNFETRVAGVKSTYLANALLTPLSAVPAKHLRYSPGEYLTP